MNPNEATKKSGGPLVVVAAYVVYATVPSSSQSHPSRNTQDYLRTHRGRHDTVHTAPLGPSLDIHVDALAGATLMPQQIYLNWDRFRGGTWAQL